MNETMKEIGRKGSKSLEAKLKKNVNFIIHKFI